MSRSEKETDVINSFRALLHYVNELGVNVNKLYDRLEKIEMSIQETKIDLSDAVTNNKKELEIIINTVMSKSEFKEILKKLSQAFENFTPPKTAEQPPNQDS